jgi:hypothetical protein
MKKTPRMGPKQREHERQTVYCARARGDQPGHGAGPEAEGVVKGRPSKYGAVRTTIDGVTFASKAEARRFAELKLLERAGEIRALDLQPRFALSAYALSSRPSQNLMVGTYVGDFAYELFTDGRWLRIVEDVKGFKTPLYRWKKKHVEAQYGIQIKEIR